MSSMLRIHLNGPDGRPVPHGPGHINGIFQHNTLQNLYIPGQEISGKVVLELLQDEVVPQVVIRFRGKMSTLVNAGTGTSRQYRVSYNHLYPIFVFEKILFEGGQRKLRATAYEWPFSFRFPSDFEMESNPFKYDKSWANISGRHPPPPSLFVSSGADLATIDYKLTARVPRNWGTDWKCEVIPDFTPVRMEFDPDSSPKVVKQDEKPQVQKWRYDENSIPRALTTKESMKHKFSRRSSVVSVGNTETQSMDFTVSIESPTVIVAGKACPIFIRVDSAPSEMPTPDFTVDKIVAHLIAETNMRVAGTFGDHGETVLEKMVALDSRADLGVKLALNKMERFDGVFKDVIHGPPTFMSISISRAYKLSIQLKIKCLDDAYTLNFKWPMINILPAKMEEGIEEAAEMIRHEALNISDNPPDFNEATGAALATSPIHVEAPPVSADVSPPTYERRRSRQVATAAPAPVPTASADTSLPSYEGRSSTLATAPVPPVSADVSPPTYDSGGYAGTQGNRLFGGS